MLIDTSRTLTVCVVLHLEVLKCECKKAPDAPSLLFSDSLWWTLQGIFENTPENTLASIRQEVSKCTCCPSLSLAENLVKGC
jgi:hypothetical protein